MTIETIDIILNSSFLLYGEKIREQCGIFIDIDNYPQYVGFITSVRNGIDSYLVSTDQSDLKSALKQAHASHTTNTHNPPDAFDKCDEATFLIASTLPKLAVSAAEQRYDLSYQGLLQLGADPQLAKEISSAAMLIKSSDERVDITKHTSLHVFVAAEGFVALAAVHKLWYLDPPPGSQPGLFEWWDQFRKQI